MTKQTEALEMAHTTFMQINERFPRRDNGDGYFDKERIACKEALAEQPTQEPITHVIGIDNDGKEVVVKLQSPLYTHPKKWQGLTDDEIWDIADFLGKNKEWDYPVMFAKTIEKVLSEKNT